MSVGGLDAEKTPGDHHFKPIQAEFRPATKRACDYTKRPEVRPPHPEPVRAPHHCRRAGRYRIWSLDFKPIQGEVRATTNAARSYTK
jgi:hypothetical protein